MYHGRKGFRKLETNVPFRGGMNWYGSAIFTLAV
tara:strand:- start:183 stop:284 length:102 start_codon:yes stop_codon:yes gene_type:complete